MVRLRNHPEWGMKISCFHREIIPFSGMPGRQKNALPREAVEGAAGASGKGQPSIWRPRKAATVWASFCSASVAAVSFSSARRTTQPIRSPSERMGAATAKV